MPRGVCPAHSSPGITHTTSPSGFYIPRLLRSSLQALCRDGGLHLNCCFFGELRFWELFLLISRSPPEQEALHLVQPHFFHRNQSLPNFGHLPSLNKPRLRWELPLLFHLWWSLQQLHELKGLKEPQNLLPSRGVSKAFTESWNYFFLQA